MSSRYYSPELCRWICADSVVGQTTIIQSFNMFAYCVNNPVNNLDFGGNFAVSITMACAIVLFGLSVLYINSICHRENSKVIRSTDRDSPRKISKRNNSVYVLLDSNQRVQYVGRTKNPEKRKNAHNRNPLRKNLTTMQIIAEGVSLPEARALEQAAMVYFHTKNTINKMHNQINSISILKWNPFKELALGLLELGWNGMTNEILY